MIDLPTDPQEARHALVKYAESGVSPEILLPQLASVLATGPDAVISSAKILLLRHLSPLDVEKYDSSSITSEIRAAVLAELHPHLHRFVLPVTTEMSFQEIHRTCSVYAVRAACGDDVADHLCEIALTTKYVIAETAIRQLKMSYPAEVSVPRLKRVFLATGTIDSVRRWAASQLVHLGDITPIPYFEDDLRRATSIQSRLGIALGLASIGSDYGTTTAIEIIDSLNDVEHQTEGLKTVDLLLVRFPQAPQSFHDVVHRLRTKVIADDSNQQ